MNLKTTETGYYIKIGKDYSCFYFNEEKSKWERDRKNATSFYSKEDAEEVAKGLNIKFEIV